jgi:hypothetical protein
MVMPAQRWIVAAWAESAYQVSQKEGMPGGGSLPVAGSLSEPASE